MEVLQIMKTEFYKITHRRSSIILAVPALLSALISICAANGILKISMPGNSENFSCMDFTFLVWTVLYGLGIGTMIWVLFAALQFSGEIERGQIKLMLLRTRSRSSVLLGKTAAVLAMVSISALSMVFVTMICYQFLVSGSELGTGTFASTIEGISTTDMTAAILLQILACMFWISLTFLVGLYAGSFVTFVIVMAGMYAGNYFMSAGGYAFQWFTGYWGTQLASGSEASLGGVVISVLCTFGIGCVIIFTAGFLLKKRDIK